MDAVNSQRIAEHIRHAASCSWAMDAAWELIRHQSMNVMAGLMDAVNLERIGPCTSVYA